MSVRVLEMHEDDSPIMEASERTSVFWFYTNELKLAYIHIARRDRGLVGRAKRLGEVLARAWHWGEPKPHHAK